MPPRYLILLIAVIGIVAVILTRVASNPLRTSDDGLQEWLLAKAPIGSHSNEVRAVVAKHGWQSEVYPTTWPRPANDPFIAGNLGGYQGFPWHVTVAAFWEFDGSNRLVNIRIRRTMDSP